MSWADDMGHDLGSAAILEQMAAEEMQEEIEENWREGFHTTREGDVLRLEEMTESHLRNTIAYFNREGYDYDTTPLEQELEGRYGDGIE